MVFVATKRDFGADEEPHSLCGDDSQRQDRAGIGAKQRAPTAARRSRARRARARSHRRVPPASTSQTCRTPAFAYVGTLRVRSTFRVDSERAATAMEPQSAIVTRNTSSVVVRPSSTLLMPLMRRLVIPFLIAAFLSSCVGEPWRTISFKLSLKRMTS